MIDKIPNDLKKRWEKQGLTEKNAYFLHLDRDNDMQKADTYLAYANGRIYSSHSPEESVLVGDSDVLNFEELQSAGRLVLTRENGEEILFGLGTNFCRDSAGQFIKAVESAGEYQAEERFCPKCGLRYPDPARKVCPKCMEGGKLYRRFFRFFLRYKKELILSVIALTLMTVASVVSPYFSSGFFYDEVIDETGEFYGAILMVLFLVVGTKLLEKLVSVVHEVTTAKIAANVVFDLKKTIFGSIERLTLSFFTGRQTGGLMAQVNEDSETIYHFFCDDVPYFLVYSVKIIVLVILLLVMEPLLTLCTLAIVPLFLYLLIRIFRRQKVLHAKQFKASKRMNGFLADIFSGVRVVKAFAGEGREEISFSHKSKALADSGKRISLFSGVVFRFVYLLLRFSVAIAWGVGGYFVMAKSHGMTYGTLLTFIAYLNMIFNLLDFYVRFFGDLADCTNSMQRLFEITDAVPDVVEKPGAISPETLASDVTVSGVSFSYRQGKKVLHDVSFHVDAGKTLGIVGHTGAGKSTLVNLLLRLYDCDDGEICIGGYNVKDLTLRCIHDHIAIVSQETYLFIGSIMDNIRYAKPDATREEIINVAKLAGAHDFIMRFPDGYETKVGAGNQDLSGGERQRISIARAILKNPDILILDEATAAMDTGTERYIQEALAKLTEGKTTIMIAHRLSTLRDADSLIVMEKGTVVETGTQEELLSREDGVYRRLFTLQQDALQHAGILE